MTFLTNVAGILVVFGFVSIAYNLITGQTSTKRKPVYWLALVMTAALVAIYIDFVAFVVREVEVLPEWSVRVAFVMVYVLLGLLLILIPWVDRTEWREQTAAMDQLEVRIRSIGLDDET